MQKNNFVCYVDELDRGTIIHSRDSIPPTLQHIVRVDIATVANGRGDKERSGNETKLDEDINNYSLLLFVL